MHVGVFLGVLGTLVIAIERDTEKRMKCWG